VRQSARPLVDPCVCQTWNVGEPELAACGASRNHDLIKGLDGFAQADIRRAVVIQRGPLLFEPYSRW
jgi:hypothetical protein